MASEPKPPPANGEPKLKIYFLPNLLTAGNLFCGFVALTKIVEADLSGGNFTDIKLAMAFILAACVFDLFDGRVAGMVGAFAKKQAEARAKAAAEKAKSKTSPKK